MTEKYEEIVRLHRNGKNNSEISRALSYLQVSQRTVYRTLKRFYESGDSTPRPRGGSKRTVRTPELIKVVRERLRRNPARSSQKTAKELNVSRQTMDKILHEDLGLKAYKKRKVHGLTEAQKLKRRQRSDMLISWHAEDEIIFSDEKLFCLQESHNPQNDRVWAASLHEIPANKLEVQRFQNVSSVMVWGAVCERGKLPLLFIEKGVKINQKYYLEQVLKNHLFPEAKKLFKDDYYCFQQDSAPAHAAKSVQEWCDEFLPDFIPKDEWPPSSPDLNPLDFSIWGYMLSQIKIQNVHSVEQFKEHLTEIWNEIPMDVVRAACKNFFPRLRAVRQARGERIETNA